MKEFSFRKCTITTASFAFALAAATLSVPLSAQSVAQPVAATDLSYADVADLAFAAPLAAVVTVTEAIRLKPAQAPGLAPGSSRFYLTGTLDSLIRGPGQPAQISWLADLPLDARGRPPKPKKSRLMLFAAPGTRPGELRLIAPDAQRPWTQPLEDRVRAILRAATAADAPPMITGVRGAFHVPGALPGESETQIFLSTADGRPVSLNVLRRPGETPRWAVALGEIVDESAEPPQRDTLLWYRLACALPATLPAASTAQLGGAEAAAARDYRIVLDGLGPCGRSRARG